MPDHVTKTIETYDSIARNWVDVTTQSSAIGDWVKKSVRIFHEMLPGKSVVVPGCGDGRDSRYLRELGCDVVSFDLSDGMLELARKLDPSGDYRKLDMRALASLDGAYDGIFASGCLYHQTRAEFVEFLDEGAKLLTADGVLYLNMKLGKGEELRVAPKDTYPGGREAQTRLAGERFYSYYTSEELRSLLGRFTIAKERVMAPHTEEVLEIWAKHPVVD